MKVRVKPIEEIRKIGVRKFPGFITEDALNKYEGYIATSHSMEYYCGKVIELDEDCCSNGWLWGDWMYNKIETPLLEVEE